MKTIFFILVFFLLSPFLYSTIINVPADQPTIQAGIDASVNADTVLVQPGTYVENINYNGKNITVASLFLTTQDTTYISTTTIDGDSLDTVVIFESGEDSTAIVTGFTITNGYSETGGGIYCYNNSNPTIENCIFVANSATYGGGIYCCVASPTIVNCIFNGNSAEENGGGICCFYGSVSLIENCTFIGNSAMFGGGIKCWNNSSPTIKNCILSNNGADEYGGGIDCAYWCNSTIEYCTISDNSSELGAGISITHESNPEITNCTISENSATAYGGGIYCYDYSNPILENVMVTNNTAGMPGGGIFCQNSSPSLTNVTITGNSSAIGGAVYCRFDCHPLLINSILWTNSPQEIYFCEEGSTNSITISYSDVQGGEAGIVTNNNGTVNWLEGNIDEDPLFVGIGEHPYSLLGDSPCIDAGIPDTTGLNLPPWDIIGNHRIWDGDGNGSAIIDMGAYEYGAPPFVEINNNVIVQNPVIQLNQNYPNPFNPITTIEFSIQHDSEINISIFNIKGQKIKILTHNEFIKGNHSIIWNGTDDNNKLVSSGVYLYKLNVNGKKEAAKKCLLLK